MSKKLAIALIVVFSLGIVMGIWTLIPEPVTVVSYEKIIICKDGICEIAVSRHYSDGSAAGTNSIIPQEMYEEIEEIQSCESGYLVTKSIKHQNGVEVAVASSISSEKTCP